MYVGVKGRDSSWCTGESSSSSITPVCASGRRQDWSINLSRTPLERREIHTHARGWLGRVWLNTFLPPPGSCGGGGEMLTHWDPLTPTLQRMGRSPRPPPIPYRRAHPHARAHTSHSILSIHKPTNAYSIYVRARTHARAIYVPLTCIQFYTRVHMSTHAHSQPDTKVQIRVHSAAHAFVYTRSHTHTHMKLQLSETFPLKNIHTDLVFPENN